jgi:putative copper export protein
MEPVTWDTIRLTLHVLAATIWVGGQLSLAALVPVLRRAAPDAPRLAARRFAVVAWSAYAVLVVTGTWGVLVHWSDADAEFRTTLIVKLAVVATSGITAYVHQRARTPALLAIFGALSAVTAVAAVLFGVLLGGAHEHQG